MKQATDTTLQIVNDSFSCPFLCLKSLGKGVFTFVRSIFPYNINLFLLSKMLRSGWLRYSLFTQ